MFDNLVESSAAKGETAKGSAFFGVTALVLGTIFLSVFVWSLYSVKLGLGDEELALNQLVAPVALPEDAPPPPPAPENQPKQKAASEDAPKNFDVRPELIQNMNESPKIPDATKTTQNTIPARRDGVPTKIGNRVSDAAGDAGGAPGREGGGGGSQPTINTPPKTVDTGEPPPPPPPAPKPSPEKPKVPSIVSGGVVNGKASNLVKPPYPPAAKAVRASGAVNVQVTIDESGNVISASATSGHPLLRPAAVQAARASKFTPTQLSGQPVKVTGVIVFNFVAQ